MRAALRNIVGWAAVVALVMATPINAKPASDPERADLVEWLAGYVAAKPGLSTNQLVGERKFQQLLDGAVPNPMPLYLGTSQHEEMLRHHIGILLGAPPNPVRMVDKRYIVASACRPHFCPEKGFVWVDTDVGHLVIVIRHFLYQDQRRLVYQDPRRALDNGDLMIASKDYADLNDLPEAFYQSLAAWLEAERNSTPGYNIKPLVIRFSGSQDIITVVTDAYHRIMKKYN
ncbi:MAG: hypothetical protein ACK4FJ_00650 [Ferrovibrio sp.]|uniref:hypothetical protein n=1 Tax=Ferrovibrio sp. TaxID=1917215 RepID=UPI00391A95AD